MNTTKFLAILLALFVSLTPALAATYVIEHDDEIDQVNDMRSGSAARQEYYSELTRLQQEIEQVRAEFAKKEADRIEKDYYDRLDRCDDDDLDDLEDLLDDLDDDEELDDDDEDDLRRLLRRCYGYDDYYDYDLDFNGYYFRKYCRYSTLDYADNFHYSDYLYDVYRLGKCRRLHLQEDVFDDYFDGFEDRYDDHDTSYDPYDDVLHELDDRDFYKYGPGAYKRWGAWCVSNRYTDGSFPAWCYERKRFITDIDWD